MEFFNPWHWTWIKEWFFLFTMSKTKNFRWGGPFHRPPSPPSVWGAPRTPVETPKWIIVALFFLFLEPVILTAAIKTVKKDDTGVFHHWQPPIELWMLEDRVNHYIHIQLAYFGQYMQWFNGFFTLYFDRKYTTTLLTFYSLAHTVYKYSPLQPITARQIKRQTQIWSVWSARPLGLVRFLYTPHNRDVTTWQWQCRRWKTINKPQISC